MPPAEVVNDTLLLCDFVLDYGDLKVPLHIRVLQPVSQVFDLGKEVMFSWPWKRSSGTSGCSCRNSRGGWLIHQVTLLKIYQIDNLELPCIQRGAGLPRAPSCG
mmetsp:Transcript_57359/g.162860  ORF Transcript_57359/g.162860 Transcript_57359/m.162860 type:complete len:104 (-) Transcript_57359:436-747(-)